MFFLHIRPENVKSCPEQKIPVTIHLKMISRTCQTDHYSILNIWDKFNIRRLDEKSRHIQIVAIYSASESYLTICQLMMFLLVQQFNIIFVNEIGVSYTHQCCFVRGVVEHLQLDSVVEGTLSTSTQSGLHVVFHVPTCVCRCCCQVWQTGSPVIVTCTNERFWRQLLSKFLMIAHRYNHTAYYAKHTVSKCSVNYFVFISVALNQILQIMTLIKNIKHTFSSLNK